MRVTVTVLQGDARDILPTLAAERSVIVTDPVWPNAPQGSVAGSSDPVGLFRSVAPLLRRFRRVVVQLGCDSDPAMLAALDMPFLRVCWLRYACPTYKGRLLHTGDVAYAFGAWPAARPGATVIPGEVTSTRSDVQFLRGPKRRGKALGGHAALAHPMPRRLEHVCWLVKWFVEPGETVVDPFAGSGTTGVAAARVGRDATLIEIEPRYADLARCRVRDDAGLFADAPELVPGLMQEGV